MRGPIALVGGNEWRTPAAPLDSWLLERSGGSVVTVLPTASKNHPEMAVETAANYFAEMGAEVDGLLVRNREDANDEAQARAVEGSRFIYLAGGDPGYLAQSLRDTKVWRAVLDANESGGILAGSSAGAMVMFDQMLRPIAKSLESGLGLLKDAIVVPHHNQNLERLPSIFEIAVGARLLGLDECTGLVLEDSGCKVLGAGAACLYVDAKLKWKAEAPADLEECI